MGKAKFNSTNTFTVIGDMFAVAGALLKARTDRGVEKLHTMSAATRDYASTLTDMPHLRAKVSAASDGIDEVANYAVHTDFEHMLVDAASFARKHPMATLGVAAAAGILAVAFFRSSTTAEPEVKSRKVPARKKLRTIANARMITKTRGSKKANSGLAHAAQ